MREQILKAAGRSASASNWSAGYMPMTIRERCSTSQGVPLLDLATPAHISKQTQRSSLDLLQQLNAVHQETRPGETELDARIRSYELAYKMQTTAADIVDVEREDRRTHG